MPVGSEHAVEEVEGVAEEDTAKDDGCIGVQCPGEDGCLKDQRPASEEEGNDEYPKRDFDKFGHGTGFFEWNFHAPEKCDQAGGG